MKRFLILASLSLMLLQGCERDERTTLTIQRIFGACEAEYGDVTDIASAEGECGIMTAIINKFEAENPDIRVEENIVFWPGYDQLTAQLAANDIPDLVTMHGSVLPDYQSRGLLEPMGPLLEQAGIDPARFTEAADLASTIEGARWSLPIDTWAPLWHINMNLFREAGLVDETGQPILPSSPEELYAQAEQFRERTGRPYFVLSTANEYASFARNFYTLALQQDAELFPEPRAADFQSDEVAAALEVFRTVFERDFTTKNQDYSAAVSGFLRGDGGVFIVGTWMVGAFEDASKEAGGPLSNGYAVRTYPRLFDQQRVFADGHGWAMPVDPRRSEAEAEAVARFLAFFAEHNLDWSRTGHLPVFTDVLESEDWLALPHRQDLSGLAEQATPLPRYVRRQFPLETIVGQEVSAAVTGLKPVSQAQADLDRRAEALLESY
ncbi:ABC transporter substrate-binding protein [Oceanicaulis sp.]|uniref:ABC transporter substrate-binding protein n=1 Tax=Oceanicaulis sp. TaxID=1924941 RepID=UPI003F71DA02